VRVPWNDVKCVNVLQSKEEVGFPNSVEALLTFFLDTYRSLPKTVARKFPILETTQYDPYEVVTREGHIRN